MVEFSDLFDNEEDVFQKKAKVRLLARPSCATPPLRYTRANCRQKSISAWRSTLSNTA